MHQTTHSLRSDTLLFLHGNSLASDHPVRLEHRWTVRTSRSILRHRQVVFEQRVLVAREMEVTIHTLSSKHMRQPDVVVCPHLLERNGLHAIPSWIHLFALGRFATELGRHVHMHFLRSANDQHSIDQSHQLMPTSALIRCNELDVPTLLCPLQT